MPDGLSAEVLAPKAAEKGVAILPGMPSYLTGQKGESHIRLNYTFPPKNRIAEGVRILCNGIQELIRMQKEEMWPAAHEINPIL